MLVNILKYSFVDNNLPLIIIISIVSAIIYIVVRVFYWVVFKKANINPALSILPIVNYAKLIEIAELPKNTIFLLFVPIANIVAISRIKYEVSIRFKKGLGFAVIYVIFPVIALYFLIQHNVVYTRLNYEEEKLINLDSNLQEVDAFKDFVPEIKAGAVPFEEGAKPYFEDSKIDLDVELKTIELGSNNTIQEPKKELVTVSSNEKVIEQAQKVEVDLSSEAISSGIQKKKCPKCGVELDMDEKYCFMCGNDL